MFTSPFAALLSLLSPFFLSFPPTLILSPESDETCTSPAPDLNVRLRFNGGDNELDSVSKLSEISGRYTTRMNDRSFCFLKDSKIFSFSTTWPDHGSVLPPGRLIKKVYFFKLYLPVTHINAIFFKLSKFQYVLPRVQLMKTFTSRRLNSLIIPIPFHGRIGIVTLD